MEKLKVSQKDQVKTVFEKLEPETSWIFRGMNKLDDKWQKVIQNNSEYTMIKVNSLLRYSWINYIF